jgi:signal transduction histidine kinase
LIGMRERVALFGGELLAGPQAGGGFTVTARLPFEPAA